jgi:hypothetical protein
MREAAPGIWHWKAVHPELGIPVSSYWLPRLRVLLDPLDVPEDVDGVEQVILSNRLHRRDALAARDRFGAVLRVPRPGMDAYAGDDPIEPYDFEQPLLGGAIVPHRVTELWPDDGALHVPELRALAIADSVIGDGDSPGLDFVPEQFMDDPEAEKRSIRAGLARLAAELDFDHLLLAHGDPVRDDGRRQLAEFAGGG